MHFRTVFSSSTASFVVYLFGGAGFTVQAINALTIPQSSTLNERYSFDAYIHLDPTGTAADSVPSPSPCGTPKLKATAGSSLEQSMLKEGSAVWGPNKHTYTRKDHSEFPQPEQNVNQEILNFQIPPTSVVTASKWQVSGGPPAGVEREAKGAELKSVQRSRNVRGLSSTCQAGRWGNGCGVGNAGSWFWMRV
ncbi:hypothetical protein ABKN59_011118 [Abortiporus biennis]